MFDTGLIRSRMTCRLNEGFTVYIERMILGEVFGSKAYRDFECLNGYNDLVKTGQYYLALKLYIIPD